LDTWPGLLPAFALSGVPQRGVVPRPLAHPAGLTGRAIAQTWTRRKTDDLGRRLDGMRRVQQRMEAIDAGAPD
jgi:hypothetical protein